MPTDNPRGNPNGNCIGLYENGYDFQYGNGNGNANGRGGFPVANENMVSAALPSNLAQPVQQAMPMDNPNPTGQQAQISRLRYDSSIGGLLMLPWPADDDGEDLLRSYLDGDDDGADLLRRYLEGDNEVMQNTASTGMTQGMHGDGAAGQINASQPQDLNDLKENSNENRTADTSTSLQLLQTDGLVDCDFSAEEMEKFLN
jgi:hypothetical protein